MYSQKKTLLCSEYIFWECESSVSIWGSCMSWEHPQGNQSRARSKKKSFHDFEGRDVVNLNCHQEKAFTKWIEDLTRKCKMAMTCPASNYSWVWNYHLSWRNLSILGIYQSKKAVSLGKCFTTVLYWVFSFFFQCSSTKCITLCLHRSV